MKRLNESRLRKLEEATSGVARNVVIIAYGPGETAEGNAERHFARRPAALGQSRLERLGIWPGEPARLLEMDLEAGPFGGFVVLGAAERDHAIEHVLLAGGAALLAALAGVMDEQDGSPLPPPR
jgi:hypothetical protein